MKTMTIKILSKGDRLFEYRDDHIIIQKKNGEYWIYQLIHDSSSDCPRIDTQHRIVVSFGKGTVEFFDSETETVFKR